jgi:hypothetical protein
MGITPMLEMSGDEDNASSSSLFGDDDFFALPLRNRRRQ